MTKAKASKPKTASPKLQKVSLPEQARNDLILWKQIKKGFSLLGKITDTKKRRSRFGGVNVIHTMSVDKCSDAKYNGTDVVFFEPAGLRDLLSQVDLDGWIQIEYSGKNDDGEHLFDVSAERVLFE